MKHHPIVLVAVALLPLFSPSGFGAAVEDVLVTGSYVPQESLTSSVTVLKQRQIEALNKRSLAELLKSVPGVLVEEQGGPGGLTAVSLRGGESNFTVVLLDGVPINDPTNFRGGGFDFSNLNVAMVERIEVVRGAQSAIYGSDALAGVINIITRRAQEGHHQSVYGQVGGDDFSDVGVSAVGRVEGLDYALDLARRDEGEPQPGSSRESNSLHMRFGWTPTQGQSVQLGYRFLDGQRTSYPEQSGGPRYALSDDLDAADYEQSIFSLGWTTQVTSAWSSAVQASRFDFEERYSSPGISPYVDVPPNASDTDFVRDQLQWVNALQLAEHYRLDIGADYRDEDGSSNGYLEFFGDRIPTDFALQRSTVGVFGHIAATPTARLDLEGSIRYDEPEDFQSEFSSQIGAVFAVGAGVSLAANWGEAYKLPSFFALGHALVGNPDLAPEKAQSWDVGIAWDALDTLRVAGTWFSNDYEDLVDFDTETFRNVNRKNIETSGLEAQIDWSPLSSLSISAQATYTDLDVNGEDTVLTGRPRWSAGIIALWQPFARWSAALDYHFTGRQWAVSRYTGEDVREKLDEFHRVDWVVRWQPITAWQFQLALDNVLDERYETAVGFLHGGRAVRAGFRFSHE